MISRIIQWVTKSKYSHVSVYVGNGQVMEAQAFHVVGLQILSQDADYQVLPTPSGQITNGIQWLFLQQGRHYSYWSDVVILIRCLFGILLPWREGKAIICSRLARDFLFQCGIPIPDENMSPEDLYEWITKCTNNIPGKEALTWHS